METNIAYVLMIGTLGFFGYVGYQAATEKELDQAVSYTHLPLPTSDLV